MVTVICEQPSNFDRRSGEELWPDADQPMPRELREKIGRKGFTSLTLNTWRLSPQAAVKRTLLAEYPDPPSTRFDTRASTLRNTLPSLADCSEVMLKVHDAASVSWST